MEDTSPKTCPYCGNELPNRRRKQCGKPECKRAYNAERARRWNAEHPGYRQRYASNTDIYPHICEQCSVEFKSHKQVQRYCGVECLRLARAARRRAAVERERQRMLPVLHDHPTPFSRLPQAHPAVQMQHQGHARLFVAGTCHRCGKSYLAHSESGVAKYCSASCGRMTGKSRHRARKRNAEHEPYRRIAIFERDGWRCHICGKRINRSLGCSHPMGATLDHIVPLAKGGADAAYNVAAAHRVCNSIKRDVGGGQLLLIG